MAANDDNGKLEKNLESPYEGQDYTQDYSEEDVMHVMNESDWQSWDEILDYLRNRGIEDPNLDPEEFGHFIDDIMTLKNKGIPFTKDYKEVYKLGHENRP